MSCLCSGVEASANAWRCDTCTLGATPSSHAFCLCVLTIQCKLVQTQIYISHESQIETKKTKGMGWRDSAQCVIIYLLFILWNIFIVWQNKSSLKAQHSHSRFMKLNLLHFRRDDKYYVSLSIISLTWEPFDSFNVWVASQLRFTPEIQLLAWWLYGISSGCLLQ